METVDPCYSSFAGPSQKSVDLKRRRLSSRNEEDWRSSSTPQMISSLPVHNVMMNHPTRAASSSPHSFGDYRKSGEEEFNNSRSSSLHSSVDLEIGSNVRQSLDHGFASTSRNCSSSHARQPRFPSPSDCLSHSFLKQAILFDRNVQLKQFLEGGLWTRLNSGSSTPSRTTSPQSEPTTEIDFVSKRLSKTAKRKRDGMAVNAYYMGNVDDPREECRMNPNRDATSADLKKIGVEVSVVDMSSNWEEQLENIIKAYKMNYRDEIHINRASMPDFDEKSKMFFEEHLHCDPELRFIKSGTGYFDVRSVEDEWIRIPVKVGDFVFLPAGIYHRFTTDKNEDLVTIRVFQASPKWKSYARCRDSDAMEERSTYLRSVGIRNRP